MSDEMNVLQENVTEENAVQEVEKPVEVERPYKLRGLKDKDLWPLLKIMRGIGLSEFKDILMQAFGKNSGENAEMQLGMTTITGIVGIIVEHAEEVKEDLYKLCSDLSGLTPEAIQDLEFGTMPLMLVDALTGVKNTAFFTALFKFL